MSSIKKIIKCRDEDLEVNAQILSFYSPAFRKLFQDNEKYIILDKPSNEVKEFIKLFHPEEEKNIQLENNMETIEKLMKYGEEFEITWLRVPLENFILNMKRGGFFDTEFYDEENCIRNIKGLLIAQKYEMNRLKEKLLNFNYCPLDKLKELDGFSELNKEIAIQLAINRISYAVDDNYVKVIKGMCKDIINVVKKEEKDEFIVNGMKGDVKIRCKKEKEIQVHSLVLIFHSQNMQIIENGMNLEEFTVDDVKIFLKFLYANEPSEFTDKVDYEELLKLAKRFDVSWVTDHVEEFLILHNKEVIKTTWSNGNEEREIKLLGLADNFGLIKLRNHVLKNMKKPTELISYTSYKKLSVEMKYLVLRKSVMVHPLEINDGNDIKLSTEGKDIVKFLDKHLR